VEERERKRNRQIQEGVEEMANKGKLEVSGRMGHGLESERCRSEICRAILLILLQLIDNVIHSKHYSTIKRSAIQHDTVKHYDSPLDTSSQIFLGVSSSEVMKAENSLDTSACRCRNRP
jgi:hypothetical protein